MDFNQIANEASDLSNKHRKVDWEAVAANLFLVPLTMGILSVDMTDKDVLRQKPMPDEWLQAVASLPELSKAGLELLADELSRNGYVSVLAATAFVELEKEAADRRKHTDTVQENVSSTGAAMLLARAEKELPGSIDRFAAAAKDVANAAWGVASFTLEKAIWAGKGLGAVATFMKDLRR